MTISQRLYVAAAALSPPSMLVVTDLGLSLQCTRAPLSAYLGALAVGAVVAVSLRRRLHAKGLWALTRRTVLVLVAVGAGGAGWMTVVKFDTWGSKCAWRHCSRVLGPSLDRSPFPVGTPSCDALHMCVNEAPDLGDDQLRLRALTRERGCAPP
jgi:hypothetical protein